MNDPAVDAIFEEMTEGLDITTNASGAFVDYEEMTTIELSALFHRTKQHLLSRGELLAAKTDTGRDLGAVYHGCVLALRKRGAL